MKRQDVRGEGGVRSGRFPVVLILFRARRGIWNIGGRALRLSVNDAGADAFQAEIPIEGIDGIGNASATIFGASIQEVRQNATKSDANREYIFGIMIGRVERVRR